ncbi:TylF/MycF/NovP-related O-methyltransferase [Verrucomicrobium spinosum]|uniref:TylF/MycF/NovP-related O-methyltransferase n=1 Tax=Verrucomicrobium spinosum TaxID=2736 RepID=UPI0009E6F2F1|nr:TylF/MycF/NovP-related O-methyltransferase [Verrucomicrobium spinosum]
MARGEPPTFYADNLAVWAKHPAFMEDPQFLRAYHRGMQSGHHMARPRGSDADIHIEWRTHVVLWAARHGAGLAGDFVECGVNTGVYSLAICDFLDFNQLDKDFWLFDTFCGIPTEQMTDQEKAEGRAEMSAAYYSDCFEMVKNHFSPWPRARLVQGTIPDSLPRAPVRAVSFLSVDLNIALPERAAMEHFWPLLTPGAVVVLDDYGWGRHEEQRAAMDEFAARAGVPILCLPTGQGLLIKPQPALQR